MLARNFKTAAELEISQQLYDALLKTLALMESGAIKDLPPDETVRFHFHSAWHSRKPFFYMGAVSIKTDCGTAGCLLGIALGVDKTLDACGEDIKELFLPNGDAIYCRKVDQGAAALRNYLVTGDPQWEKVCARTNDN